MQIVPACTRLTYHQRLSQAFVKKLTSSQAILKQISARLFGVHFFSCVQPLHECRWKYAISVVLSRGRVEAMGNVLGGSCPSSLPAQVSCGMYNTFECYKKQINFWSIQTLKSVLHWRHCCICNTPLHASEISTYLSCHHGNKSIKEEVLHPMLIPSPPQCVLWNSIWRLSLFKFILALPCCLAHDHHDTISCWSV